MTCVICQHQNCKKFGYYSKRRVQRWRCNSCSATFADPNAPEYVRPAHSTDPKKIEQALAMMLEGMSVRAISRLTGLHKNTILSLMMTAAENATRVFKSIRNFRPTYLQCDEVWGFLGKKNRHIRKGDSADCGDQWIFVALDEQTKFVPHFEVGKRTRETTERFLTGLRWKMSEDRFQITTDGYHFYRSIQSIFAGYADFAQLIKIFGDYGQHDAQARYSPPAITEVISRVIDGRPDEDHISTSHVERSNLSLRMHLRRFTRLTNAFSRKYDNLKAAVTLFYAWYNFCRVHSSLRVTPAMAAGLTDHVWSIGDLIGLSAATK